MNGKSANIGNFLCIRRDVLVCLFLVIAICSVYWQVRDHSFITYDDDLYVTKTPHVQNGLTKESIVWAFSFNDVFYWRPVTWLSHMIDCQLHGLNAGLHHLTNLILHIFNSLLLFLVFKRTTGAIWRSAFVAALFALHPINVESVAWVAERKNVLSTFFWLLTMLAYVHYAKRPTFHRYLPVFIFFVLGLLVKPMLTTLPFVLLLIDYWPLERIRFGKLSFDRAEKTIEFICSGYQGSRPLRLLLEKIPLILFSLISICISSISVQRFSIVLSYSSKPMTLRIENALVSYVNYIGKTFWPLDLAAKAVYHYCEALRINPGFAFAHNNLGAAMIRDGKIERAIFHFQEALRIKPDYIEANKNLKKILKFKSDSLKNK